MGNFDGWIKRRSPPPNTEWDEVFDEYVGTPYLSLLVNACTALGVFLGAWIVILLIGDWVRGSSGYWPLILILVGDVAINIAVRLIRFRHRRSLGLSTARRGWRSGRSPRPSARDTEAR